MVDIIVDKQLDKTAEEYAYDYVFENSVDWLVNDNNDWVELLLAYKRGYIKGYLEAQSKNTNI